GVQAGAGVVDHVVEALALPGALEFARDGARERVERRAVADVERQRPGFAPLGDEARAHVGGLSLPGAKGEYDVDAALGQVERHAAAEAAATTGDERDRGLVGSIHRGSPSRGIVLVRETIVVSLDEKVP